jgi:predicted regulator of Ras-like GTPase activity (Roadblock/LC7/MglB family)
MVQEYRSEQLERSLQKLHLVVDGLRASVLVNVDGLLMASFPPGNNDHIGSSPTSSPQVAAMAATLIGLAENTLTRLAQGRLDRILMEGEEGLMVVYPAGTVASLAILLEKDARLERVFYAANRTTSEVLDVLEPH